MKNENIVVIIGVLVIAIMAVTGVSAFTQDNFQAKSLNFENEVKDSECSSIILQVNENQSVASFRRDEECKADIYIENGTWDNVSYIKQYKKEGGEFFQALMTDNGYVIGVGGGTDGDYNKKIEELASKMVLSNDPGKYIGEVQDILSGYKKGHFIIKDPKGKYFVAWPNEHHEGKINDGEYVCIPNLGKYSFKGNFSGNPVEEAIDIASTDSFGIERRDIITYDLTKNESGYSVDVFASNDDNAIRGGGTGALNDNIYFLDKYYAGGDLPIVPDKVELGSYQFGEQKMDFFEWFWDAIHKKE